MLKGLRKFWFVVVTLFVCLLGVNTVLAAELEDVSDSVGNASATFEMIKTGDEGNGIEPRILIQGPAGYARLDYVHGAQMIEWQVCPATTAAYFFIGDLTIIERDTGDEVGYKTLRALGCSGVESGVVDLIGYNMTRGDYYYAVLDGKATDNYGEVFDVVDGARLVFCY